MSARDYALTQLDARPLPGWTPNLLRVKRHQLLEAQTPPEDRRDRALAEQLIVGVIKNQLRLRLLIQHFANRPIETIDELSQKIIAIGMYQIHWLTRIPIPAAVNEAVEQSRHFKRERAAGFINAVLRRAASLPLPPIPDRERHPARYAVEVLSHPRDLFDRLLELMPPTEALRLCETNQGRAPTIVRLLPGATPESLAAPDVTVTPHHTPGLFVIEPGLAPQLAAWAEQGIAQAQDPTAATVVDQMQLQPGQRVLDRCAGLGTKTLQLCERVGPAGQVVAVDPSEPRGKILRDIARRRGMENLNTFVEGALRDLPLDLPRDFDAALVDAPCSNSGVLARRPEARYRQDDASLASVQRLQDFILDDTARAIRPGGNLVYSTCSIWPEENQQRIAAFLQRHPDYRLLRENAALPSFDEDPTRYHDGGYFAVLERADSPPA